MLFFHCDLCTYNRGISCVIFHCDLCTYNRGISCVIFHCDLCTYNTSYPLLLLRIIRNVGTSSYTSWPYRHAGIHRIAQNQVSRDSRRLLSSNSSWPARMVPTLLSLSPACTNRVHLSCFDLPTCSCSRCIETVSSRRTSDVIVIYRPLTYYWIWCSSCRNWGVPSRLYTCPCSLGYYLRFILMLHFFDTSCASGLMSDEYKRA